MSGENNLLPFGAASVSGHNITIDDAMANPTKVTRTIADLIVANLWAHRLFTDSGGVEGGAVLFERPNPLATDLYVSPERDLRKIAPGDEIPMVGFTRGVPMIARPDKIGGAFEMVKEAIKRNDVGQLARNMQRIANTVVRMMENMAMAEAAAVITAEARFITATDTIAAMNALTVLNRTGADSPLAQFLAVNTFIDAEERGKKLDSVIINTLDWAGLVSYYGDAATVKEQLAEGAGINNVYPTPRRAQGSALFFEEGGTGELRQEFPLEQESEYFKKTQTWWYGLTWSPVMYVVDQFGMLELRGL